FAHRPTAGGARQCRLPVARSGQPAVVGIRQELSVTAMAIAVLVAVEDRVNAELVREGHVVVARCDNADELASVLALSGAEHALIDAEPRYRSSRLEAEADAQGVRLVALAGGDACSRCEASL